MKKKNITLRFDPALSFTEKGKHVRDGLSASFLTGDNLWVSCDERSALERLKRISPDTFAEHQSFDLNEFLDLPANGPCEVDVEGMAYEDHYIWLVGSHSLARKKPRKGDSPENQLKRLSKLKEDPNRYLMARIPLVLDSQTGDYTLCKRCPNPDHPDRFLTAAQLVMDQKGNQLLDLMAQDPHFKDFMKIPGKDNGFDIEGLAVNGEKIFLGIRGPVLRGWAAILELQVQNTRPGYFELQPVDSKLYKKHFLHMEGMGVRELRVVGDDLLILAGPTMDLDGTIAVYRWPKGVLQQEEAVVHRKELERLFDLPHGQGPTSGQDKAEGMALVDNEHVLVVYDTPTEDRKPDENSVIADLCRLP